MYVTRGGCWWTAYVASFLTLLSKECADSVYFAFILEIVLPEENICNVVRCFDLPKIIVQKSERQEKVKGE
jgi:hypothetical protein